MTDPSTADGPAERESATLGEPELVEVPLGDAGPSLTTSTASLVSVQVVVIGLSVVLSVLVTRALGPAGSGIYALAILLPNVLSIIWNMGLSPANAYFLSGRQVTAPAAVRTCCWLSLVYGLAGVITIVPLVANYGNALFPHVPQLYLWYLLPAFLFALSQTNLSGVLLGLQDFKGWNLAALYAPASNLVLAILLVLILHMSVLGAILAYGISQAFALVMTLYLLREHWKPCPMHEVKAYARMSASWGFFSNVGNIVMYLNYRIDLFIVGHFLAAYSVGIYALSVQIVERTWLLSFAVSSALLPKLTSLSRGGSDEERLRLTPIAARGVLLAGLAFALAFILVGYPVVYLLFGSKFLPCYGLILLFLPGVTCLGVSRVIAYDIASRNRVELNTYTCLVELVVNGVANWYMVQRYGIAGGAISTTVVYILDLFLRVFFYTRLSGNHWTSVVIPKMEDVRLMTQSITRLCQQTLARLPARSRTR